jgi:hypothetical protein
MKRTFLIVGGCLFTVIVVVVTLVVVWFRTPIVPSTIAKQSDFALFYPKGDPSMIINRSTMKYDKSIGQFSFVASFGSDKLIFGEQATPEDFYASQNYYDNLLTKMGKYYTFQDTQGTVDLTKDPSVGKNVGVINTKGTLVFVDSDKQLSNNDWREVFNSLVYQEAK